MSELWSSFLIKLKKTFNYIGDHSGCHQKPERCFNVNGYIFPLCARCCGVTIGQIISIVFCLFGYRVNIYISIVMLLVMGVDWFIQFIKIKESNNTRRFFTGLLGGFGLFMIYFHIFDFTIDIIFH